MTDASSLQLRVFISSPGDVADERNLAREVLHSLPNDPVYRGRIGIEAVSYDDPSAPVAMAAHLTPQAAINVERPRPSQCDVVIVILWSRMGTPLPVEYLKPDGSPYRSGTEWEFFDAVDGAAKTGKPTTWVYRRDEEIKVGSKDPQRDEKLRQADAVDVFFAEFADAAGSLRHSYHSYHSPTEFAKLFRAHLHSFIAKRLAESNRNATEPAKTPLSSKGTSGVTPESLWSGNPYRGLDAFDSTHRAIFFGRDLETDQLIRRMGEDQHVLAVIGASGSGKSSLVAAGLLPRLAGAFSGPDEWVLVRFTPAEKGDNPFLSLAMGLFPLLPGAELSVDAIADCLANEPSSIDEFAAQALQSRSPEAQLLLFADQFEELFTARVAERHRAPMVALVETIARSRRVRLVLTLRADYYEHCLRYDTLAARLRDSSFPLAAPTGRALTEMIEQPARAAGIELEQGLVDEILRDAGDKPGSLALLEFTLERLYEMKRNGLLTRSAYRQLKGVDGAIEIQGERAVRDPAGNVNDAALWGVFDALAEVDETGGAVRRRAAMTEFSDAEQALIQSLIKARLVTTDRDEAGQSWAEVAHEAVLRAWPRYRDWLARHQGFKLWRKRLEVRLQDGSLLQGAPLAVAESMLRDWGEKLAPAQRDFIARSSAAESRRKQRRRGGYMALLAGLFGLSAWLYPMAKAERDRRTPIYRAEEWEVIPAGEFLMGAPPEDDEASSDERPQRKVTIAKPFRLLRHEVTFEEYDHFAYATGRRPPSDSGLLDGFGPEERKNLPVINVPWREARAYAEWLTRERQEKRPFRLPTEAEWEYAVRGGTTTRRFWGDNADEACAYANVFDRGHEHELVRKYGSRVLSHPAHDCDDGYAFLAPIKSLKPNRWHLYDLLGNVYEWVQDCYQETYEGVSQQGGAVERKDCNKRVIRGGAWSYLAPKDVPESVRSSSRFGVSPEMQHSTLGFRLAQDLE